MIRLRQDVIRTWIFMASGAATRRMWPRMNRRRSCFVKVKASPANSTPCYIGHVLMEHRQGLAVDVEITEADGFAERAAALRLLKRHRAESVAADKAYDTREFVAGCRRLGTVPHVAQNIARTGGSAIDARTTRHRSYLASQRLRKRIEEIFGWSKDGRALRKMRVVGMRNASFMATLTIGCNTLLRVAKLLAAPA